MSSASLYGINAQGKALQGLGGTRADCGPNDDRVKKYRLRANPRMSSRLAAISCASAFVKVAPAMGTVFYDLDVPDFTPGD